MMLDRCTKIKILSSLHFPIASFFKPLFRAFLGNDDDSSEPQPKQDKPEQSESSPELGSVSSARDVAAAPTPRRPLHVVRKPIAVKPTTSMADKFPGATLHPAGNVGIVPSYHRFLPPEQQAPESLYVKMELAELTPRARSTQSVHQFSTPQSSKHQPKLDRKGRGEFSENVGAALKTLNMGMSSVFFILFSLSCFRFCHF